MKKILLFIACLTICSFTANAQLGGILRQAANKATQKATDKAVEKATEKAVEAIESELNKESPSKNNAETSSQKENNSIESIMRQLPMLPTVQELVNFKTAELNEQTLKLMTSPVTKFSAKAMNLSMEVLTFSAAQADSAQIMETAYKQAELATGLSRDEIEKLSQMSDEEQEAYLQAHYKEGQAESALLKQAAKAGEYLKPLQPLLDEWESFNNTIETLYKKTDEKCKAIYAKYSNDLEKVTDEAHKKLLIKYFSEIAPLQREAVSEAHQIRLNQQLPVAEKIEEEMVKIRLEHQELISVMLNYPQLTATQYFSEISRLIDIPEYK